MFEIIERFIDKGDTEKARYDLASIKKILTMIQTTFI